MRQNRDRVTERDRGRIENEEKKKKSKRLSLKSSIRILQWLSTAFRLKVQTP